MSELYFIILFIGFGYAAGILMGMLGIGGGIAFVPLLYIFLPYTSIDISQITYIVLATSLFAGSVGTIGSAGKHYLSNNIDVRKALYLASGSVISAVLAPLYVVTIPGHMLQIIFAIVFSSLAIKMTLESREISFGVLKNPIKDIYLIPIGLAVGVISAFAGIGGGIICVPVFAYLSLLDFRRAIGTSSLITSLTTAASAISYALITPKGYAAAGQVGYIYLYLGLPLGIGSAAGALSGVKFVLNSNTLTLKKIFSVLLIVVVIKIIFDL